jgi:hypothetical protein
MQATVNDSIQKTIEKLSANYDRLSEKYVEGKKRPKKPKKEKVLSPVGSKVKAPVREEDEEDEEDRRLTQALKDEYYRQLALQSTAICSTTSQTIW